jgi:hypothetical protein
MRKGRERERNKEVFLKLDIIMGVVNIKREE